MSKWHLYLIRLKNGHLYTGIAKDVEARFSQHCANGKQAAKFLRGKGPLKLVFQQKIGNRSQALKAEASVKKLSKANKEQLVQGRFELDMILDLPPGSTPSGHES